MERETDITAYLSSLGDLELLKERLQELNMERSQLEEERELRSRVGLPLSEDSQEFLDTILEQESMLESELREMRARVARLRQQVSPVDDPATEMLHQEWDFTAHVLVVDPLTLNIKTETYMSTHITYDKAQNWIAPGVRMKGPVTNAVTLLPTDIPGTTGPRRKRIAETKTNPKEFPIGRDQCSVYMATSDKDGLTHHLLFFMLACIGCLLVLRRTRASRSKPLRSGNHGTRARCKIAAILSLLLRVYVEVLCWSISCRI